jgi:hypothetical protein
MPMHFTTAQQQEIMQIGELLRNRDPLYKVDFHRMINRQSKMHPSDYMRHYINAAKIILKCSEELSKLDMHPDATPRTYLHWLSVMLGVPAETFTIGSMIGCDWGYQKHPSAQTQQLPSAQQLLDSSTSLPVDCTTAPT